MRLRVFAVVIALCLAGRPAFAQLTGGVKGGVGFASLSSDGAIVQELLDGTRTGLIIGGFIQSPLIGMFSIVAEGLYTQKGATGTFPDPAGDLTARIDYFEVPILLSVDFSPSSTTRPFVYGGIASAFETSTKLVVESGGDEIEDVDFGDQIKSTDFSVVFGGGVRSGHFGVEARYNLGMASIQEDTIDGEDVKNRQFTILFSWFIR